MQTLKEFENSAQEVLLSLEKTQKEFWNIDRNTANFLNMLIKIHNSKNALEIGTSNGYSGIWLADALKHTGGKLTTIEFWDKRQSVAKENFRLCNVEDIIETKLGSALLILDEMSCEIEQGLREPFDFIFIDANKLEYIEYFHKIDPLLKSGGIIAADNTISHAKKVEPYLKALVEHPSYQNQMLNFEAGLFVSLKI